MSSFQVIVDSYSISVYLSVSSRHVQLYMYHGHFFLEL